ncbi:MAG: GspE/PulE family protein [Arcobacteraceae bacterium]
MSILNQYTIDYNLIGEFDGEKLKYFGFAPIQKDDFLIIVVHIPHANLEYLTTQYHLPIHTIAIEESELLFLLENSTLKAKIYANALNSIGISDYTSSYINNFLLYLIDFAILKNASDIHIETQKEALTIRLRIDGLLQHFFRFDWEFYPVISSVIKLLSSMDITQKRISQNGRFSKMVTNNEVYDFRVSVMPTINGESIVLRILDKKSVNTSLDYLGFDAEMLTLLKKSIHAVQGLILVTGPTGSGKTTTLYSILKELNSINKKIITIEDPVEYHIENIQQIAVNSEINLGFTEILRDVLRQDPDIIMIGEIRDISSLKIAIQASLTGHLVLATLHANDSISTINRLLDLEAEPFLIASTLKAIISQRLVLKLCESCKVLCDDSGVREFEAKGCEKCNLTGYQNRVMVNEILPLDERMASMIIKQQSSADILEYAKNKGFKTLFDNALEKVKEGTTSLKEVYKVTRF